MKPQSSSNTNSSSSSRIQSKYPLPAHVMQGYVKQPAYGSNNFSRKHKTEEEYFEDGEDEVKNKLEYQPASDSEDSEEDPLDAFMSGIEVK